MNHSFNVLSNSRFVPSHHLRYSSLAHVDPELLEPLNERERATVHRILATAVPQPPKKLVDLRVPIDLVFARFDVVLLLGEARRPSSRSSPTSPFTRAVHRLVAVLLLIGINLSISAFILLSIYLIKSALGIDLFPIHLKDVMSQF